MIGTMSSPGVAYGTGWSFQRGRWGSVLGDRHGRVEQPGETAQGRSQAPPGDGDDHPGGQGPDGGREWQLDVLDPAELAAGPVRRDLEDPRPAHHPAGVLHFAPARRVPSGDHHVVSEADRPDTGPCGQPGSDAVAAAHPRAPYPLALAGPVGRGPPGVRRPGVHGYLGGDPERCGHAIRLLTARGPSRRPGSTGADDAL